MSIEAVSPGTLKKKGNDYFLIQGNQITPVEKGTLKYKDDLYFILSPDESIPVEQSFAPEVPQIAASETPQAPVTETEPVDESLTFKDIALAPIGAIETAMSVGSGMLGGSLAGIVGMGELATGADGENAANTINRISEKLHYKPSTKSGKAFTKAITYPMEKLAELNYKAGEVTSDVTDSPGAGAAVNAGLTLVEMVMAPEVVRRTAKGVKKVSEGVKKISDKVTASKPEPVPLSNEYTTRQQLFEQEGITPNRFNITQDINDAAYMQEAGKRAGPVAENIARQDAQLIENVEGKISKIGPEAFEIKDANASAYNVISDVISKHDEAVSLAYRQAEKVAGKQFRVQPERLVDAINKNRGSDTISKGVISSLIGYLESQGMFKVGAEIDLTKGAPKLKSSDFRKITVKEAEGIRQHINRMYDSTSPEGRRISRNIKDAMEADVEWQVADKEIFVEARKSKQALEEMQQTGKRDKFDRTKGGLIEDIIDNVIKEEQIIDKIISRSTSDVSVAALKEFYLTKSGPEGIQAWNDIRAQILRDALEKAVSTQGKTPVTADGLAPSGSPLFNSLQFKKELARLTRSKRYDLLFSLEEQALIKNIMEIGKLRIPPRAAFSGEGPTSVAVKRAAMSKIPGFDIIQALFEEIKNAKGDIKFLDTKSIKRTANGR